MIKIACFTASKIALTYGPGENRDVSFRFYVVCHKMINNSSETIETESISDWSSKLSTQLVDDEIACTHS